MLQIILATSLVRPRAPAPRASIIACAASESKLLQLQPGSPGARDEVERLTSALVESVGVEDPALSPLIEGDWVLIHTSSSSFDIRNPLGRRSDGTAPGLEGAFQAVTGGARIEAPSSSPIQRAVVEAFSVTQSIRLQGPTKRVEQCVDTPLGTLKLGARASVTPEAPKRISFAFDEGFFALREPVLGVSRIPYPAPFKLLGKEAEGYLDTVYLSEQLRVSVGNKGTRFVLRRAS